MNSLTWAKHLSVIGCIVLLGGCAQIAPPPLYMWEGFTKHQYSTLQGVGINPVDQIGALEAHAEKARAAGAALPPGFRAHLGMLKLTIGDVDRARELWIAEKATFPESAPYMNQLLKRLDGPAQAPKTEKPA